MEARTEWEWEGKQYKAQAVESRSCAPCAFYQLRWDMEGTEGCQNSPCCIGPYRADGKTIIWIEKQS